MTKDLRGECQQCGGSFHFPADHIGQTANCPQCGQLTELVLAAPAQAATPMRRKAIVFTVCVVLIVGGGLLAANIALKRARRLQAERQNAARPADPFAAQGFQVSPVSVDKAPGTSTAYVVGSIVNTTSRQRFDVRVTVDLFDGAGSKIGVAMEHQRVMGPNASWSFRSVVTDKRVTAAKVAAVTESP